MKPYITLKATISTFLIFLILLGTCVLTMVDTKSDGHESRKFFYIPFIIGLGICLISCYTNITDKINLIEKELEETNKPKNINNAKLTTCPEYWKKNVVRDKDDNQYTMCYNTFKSSQSEDPYFIGGQFKTHDTNPTFEVDESTLNNHSFSQENLVRDPDDPSGDEIFTREYALTRQSNLLLNQINNDIVENFSTTDADDKVGEDGLIKPPTGQHRHYVNTITDFQKILSSDGKVIQDPDHTHSYIHDYNFLHENGSDFILNDLSASIYNPKNSNLDFWLNPYVDEHRNHLAEINLTKLNSIDNNCELTKPFVWVQAQNQCNKSVI